MAGDFSVPILNVVGNHTNKTREILASYIRDRNGTSYIRDAILHLAKKNGFIIPSEERPNYVPENIWQKKSVAEKKTEKIDYSYIPAFYWLAQLPEFEKFSKARIVREAIINLSSQSQ